MSFNTGHFLNQNALEIPTGKFASFCHSLHADDHAVLDALYSNQSISFLHESSFSGLIYGSFDGHETVPFKTGVKSTFVVSKSNG